MAIHGDYGGMYLERWYFHKHSHLFTNIETKIVAQRGSGLRQALHLIPAVDFCAFLVVNMGIFQIHLFLSVSEATHSKLAAAFE